MVMSTVAALARSLPVVILIWCVALSDMSYCIANDDHLPHTAFSRPLAGCDIADCSPKVGHVSEPCPAKSSTCRYVSVPATVVAARKQCCGSRMGGHDGGQSESGMALAVVGPCRQSVASFDGGHDTPLSPSDCSTVLRC
ncbi:hypothetical protein FJY68_00600 [candidate division WOR-3 bacterium]|uniref:Uncharacterized protein n=1 Tax=candidate division WOR-3 bacterium TaxID=2052148 RepID=A0A937XDX7_UNCW3|nr:hypothetical protein [candidate division WOR-3 bacterium]